MQISAIVDNADMSAQNPAIFGKSSLLAVAILLLASCGYGPPRHSFEINNVVARPQSHQMAVSVDYAKIREPEGFINTFPNGGVPQILVQEARVYVIDLTTTTVHLAATIPDFGGIPMPKAVHIHGWRADALYFSLFGYGGNPWDGDDLSDEHRLFYRILPDNAVEAISVLPLDIDHARNSGPTDSPPFLRFSRGHRDIEIAVDQPISESDELLRVLFDEDTGKVKLLQP